MSSHTRKESIGAKQWIDCDGLVTANDRVGDTLTTPSVRPPEMLANFSLCEEAQY
jgi:hypothetical protein